MQLCWQTLHRLEKEYGDSFFILDLRQFETNYKDLLQVSLVLSQYQPGVFLQD